MMMMKKIAKLLNCFVFIAATVAIMGVFYEGMSLEWYSIVAVFIIIMDFSFIVATVLNLFCYGKNKVLLSFNIFSCVMILIAIVMKVMDIEYPIITLVLWYFYIWFYYGAMLSKDVWTKHMASHR